MKIDDPITTEGNDEEYYRWQLRRISKRDLPLVGEEDIVRFEDDQESHVYILDSGIDASHDDFKGRIAPADEHKSFVRFDNCSFCTEKKDTHPLCDCNGHGTHCAGIVGSDVAGYSQHTTIHSGKVFN